MPMYLAPVEEAEEVEKVDRGRESFAVPPPSEPYERISRIRLSS